MSVNLINNYDRNQPSAHWTPFNFRAYTAGYLIQKKKQGWRKGSFLFFGHFFPLPFFPHLFFPAFFFSTIFSRYRPVRGQKWCNDNSVVPFLALPLLYYLWGLFGKNIRFFWKTIFSLYNMHSLIVWETGHKRYI